MSAIVVALEGPSDTGKSRLAAELCRACPEQIVSLPCYVDFSPGSLPPARCETRDEQMSAFLQYLDLDRERALLLNDAAAAVQLVLVDRSWVSLLAHVHAVECSGGPSVYADALRALRSATGLLHPDAVLALRASAATRAQRLEVADGDSGTCFTSAAFNSHVDDYLDGPARELVPLVEVVDAEPSAVTVAANVTRVLQSHFPELRCFAR